MVSIRQVRLPRSLTRPMLDVRGDAAFIQDRELVGRASLSTASWDWLFERSPAPLIHKDARAHISVPHLWVNPSATILVEMVADRELFVISRRTDTGEVLWTKSLPPAPAGMKRDYFLASDRSRLVLCSQDVGFSKEVTELGGTEIRISRELGCSLETIRMDPESGGTVYSTSHNHRFVDLLESRAFHGLCSGGSEIDAVDFETGDKKHLWKSSHALGSSLSIGESICAAWHHRGRVGVEWVSDGKLTADASWRHARARETRLHQTEGGVALQVNDQSLTWLGHQSSPIWHAKAKPWIYNVHSATNSPFVFVGTDGRGGHLHAFDEAGHEVLKLRPTMGGFGDLSRIPGRRQLISAFRTSRSYKKRPSLLVLSMDDLGYKMIADCGTLLGTWADGAVCIDDNQLMIVEIAT